MLPAIPDTIDDAGWRRLDLLIREEIAERDAAYRAQVVANDVARIAAANRQADAMLALVQQQTIATKALDAYTDAEIVFGLVRSLAAAWGPGTTASELVPLAQAMLASYRKSYPAP